LFLNAFREFYSLELLSNGEVLEDLPNDSRTLTDMHDYESNDEGVTEAFAKMIEQTKKGIVPYKDVIEKINLGTEEQVREI